MSKESAKMLLVGAGGIGSSLAGDLCPAVSKSEFNIQLTILDSDYVSEDNIAFQRFHETEVGMPKAMALSIRYNNNNAGVLVRAQVEDLYHQEQLSSYDLVIVAVDRPTPRRLVHRVAEQWVDLRCSGDGWLLLDPTLPTAIIGALTPDHDPASCQNLGALAESNIQYGYAVAAAHGAQWVMQWLRRDNGLQFLMPKPSMGRISTGVLQFPNLGKLEVSQLIQD